MDACPACGVATAPGQELCDSCGVRLEGSTASFAPVGEVEERAVAGELGMLESPVLVVRKGAEVGERFYLEPGELTVGRDPASAIFLNDVTVSRNHAVLHASAGEVSIADAGSLNGTYVNGICVDRAILRSGDAVQVGRFQMIFLSGGGV